MAEKLTKLRVFAFVLLIFIFLFGVVLYFQYGLKKEPIEAFTEKKSYSVSDELKVEIKNNMKDKVCFSSCYPYLMQTKDGGWENYNYSQCDEQNKVEACVDSNGLKAFAISLKEMFIQPALHRLAIPACIGCAVGEQFRVDKILYSNEFEIKK